MSKVIDSYRILAPSGRNLKPEGDWLASFPLGTQIWATWTLVDGEVIVDGPLSSTDRSTLIGYLRRAERVAGILSLAVTSSPFRLVQADQIAELHIEVRG